MICGIGCDIVEVERFCALCGDGRFMDKCFTAAEREYIRAAASPAQSAAACFAAKEAVVKALGSGFSGVGLHDAELLHRENGSPYVRLSGGAARLAGGAAVHISLSHTRTAAAAFCVLEK